MPLTDWGAVLHYYENERGYTVGRKTGVTQNQLIRSIQASNVCKKFYMSTSEALLIFFH